MWSAQVSDKRLVGGVIVITIQYTNSDNPDESFTESMSTDKVVNSETWIEDACAEKVAHLEEMSTYKATLDEQIDMGKAMQIKG